MTTAKVNPESSPPNAAVGSRAGVWVATALGLGYAPVAPGTAGSLASVALFVLLGTTLSSGGLWLAYVSVLVVLGVVGAWSTSRALPHWTGSDPQAIVIDEVLGQWVTYGGLIVASLADSSPPRAGMGWKYLLAGFILFRAFDVLKPFPIRRSEKIPGAAGVLLDDVLAGIYGALGLLLLACTGWLN